MNTDCDYCGRSDNEGSVTNEDGVTFHYCHRHEAEVRSIAGLLHDTPAADISDAEWDQLPPEVRNRLDPGSVEPWVSPVLDLSGNLSEITDLPTGFIKPVFPPPAANQRPTGDEPPRRDRCVHCGKAVHNEIHDGHTFVIDDETGGDVCGWDGGNEPHAVEATVTFTVSATFKATQVNYQDAWMNGSNGSPIRCTWRAARTQRSTWTRTC